MTEPEYEGATPEAPYGYKKNGEPYQRRPKGSVKPSQRKRQQTSQPDYTEAVNGLFQLAALPLSFAAPADAWAITAYGPGISTALNDLAQERPEVAAVLDKVLQAGPYGALIAAIVPLVAQLLANHGLLPAGFFGTRSKEDILASLTNQAAAMQQAMRDHAAASAGDPLSPERV